jgi:proton-translocating NADH-quinone oxidoreductase chain N
MFSLLILMPLLSVIILNLPFRRTMVRAAFWVCLALFAAQIAWIILPVSAAFEPVFKLNLIIDDLSRVVLFCIGIVSIASLFVGEHVFKDEDQKFNFLNLLILAFAGMNGVVMVKDVFSLYVFLEITAVASFVLISLYRDINALEAAFKYLILSAIATVMMLSSIALLLLVSGDTSFSAINAAIMTSPHGTIITLAMGLFICGLFIKGGLMPFHGWLPDAYSAAPSPVSVLLAGIVTKTVGIYALIRIVTLVFVFDSHLKLLLMFVGALSIVIGALAALGQSDMKRMLAYSSISQVGYIVIGLGCGTPLSVFGAIFHLLNHAIFKSLLFVNSAAVESQTGTRDMDKLSGLAERMPVTGVTSLLAMLSASGIPPLSGFWSKLIIVMALWISGYYAFAVTAVAASVITLAYFLSMQRRVFFGKIGSEFANIKEAGFKLMFPSLMLAILIVLIGLLFPFLARFYVNPAALLGG